MWKTGHSLIKEKVAETQAILAGEMSGHFMFKDRWNGYDDAIYAGARLLEILSKTDEDSEKVGTEWLIEQSKELKKFGVPVLHYYTLGKPRVIKNVVKELV